MSIQNVQSWYNKIPRLERSQPLVTHEGTAYTPDQILDEVRRQTSLGNQLQLVIEQRRFTDVGDKYALAVLRLKERLQAMSPSARILIGKKYYSPEQALKEVQDGTLIGRQMIEEEVRRVEGVLA
jgi:hypothetical protein